MAATPETGRAIIGRPGELAQLDAAVAAVATGSGGVVLISGTAGIGKTRLAVELAERARRLGATVRLGQCIEFTGAGVPYLPLAEALGSLPGVPTFTSVAGEGPGASGTLALFQGVRQALTRAAAGAPLVVVVEDVHWADASTVDLLAFLGSGVREHSVLLVLTLRDDEPDSTGAVARLVSRLRRTGAADVVELGPMPRDELIRLLDDRAATPLSASVADAIAERSGGNPFFAEELLDAIGHGDDGLPTIVREALARRVDRLGRNGRAVARIAAAVGRDVPYPLLAAVAAMSSEHLRQALRDTVSCQVLVADQQAGRFRFRHALLAEAVYETLLPGELEDLHGRIAAALTAAVDRGEMTDLGTASALARHWAAARRPREAFSAALRAAAEAESACGLAEALAHLERVVELWPRVSDAERIAGVSTVAILARAAEHADDIGDGRRAAELVRRAIAKIDEDREPHRVALLYERLGSYLLPIGDRAGGLAACRRAVDLVPAELPSPERIRVVTAFGHALMLSWRHDDARPWCAEAIAMAAALGEESRAYRARDVLGTCLCYLGRPDEGIGLLEEACRRTPPRGSPEWLIRPYVFLSDVLVMIGRLADAVRVAVDGLAYVYSIGHERSVGNVLTANLAEARLGTGDWDGAAGALAAALRLGGDYWSHHLYVWSAQLATWRGDLDAADRYLDAGTQALSEPSAAAYHRLVAAERAAWAGELDAAQRLVDAGLRDTEATGAAFLTVRLAALGLRIEADSVAARSGDRAAPVADPSAAGAPDRGRSLLDRAATAAATAVGVDAPAWLAVARAEHQRLQAVGERDRWPVVAARWRSAATGWQAAASGWSALERPYLAAYASWRHAEALVAAGDPAFEATTPARSAYDTAGRLGAMALRREVERLGTRARITLEPLPVPRPTDAALAGTFGLTARELEVLRLLGLGYTNRDIAETLTISVKTASVHVTHILRKLGVPGRVQAAAYARQLPSG